MGDHSGEAGDATSSSLGLLDAEHVDVFRNALERILSTDIAETTFSEIIDGLPMRSTWLQFALFNETHPVNVLGHDTLCDGAREKARRFRDEFDIYMLSFPSKVCVYFCSSMYSVHGQYALEHLFHVAFPEVNARPGGGKYVDTLLSRPCTTFNKQSRGLRNII